LHRAEPGADASRVTLTGPAIVLAERDEVRVVGETGEAVLRRGSAVYVTPEETTLELRGPGIAWVATTGVAPEASAG
jgi:mannose-6-phosphate isomerase